MPGLLAAIKWAAPRLKDVGVLLNGADGLPLSVLNDTTPEGKIVLSSAKQILANLDKKDVAVITVADSSNTAQIFSASPHNGDGVIPPEAIEDPYEDKEAAAKRRQMIGVLVILLLAAVWVRWDAVQHRDAGGRPMYFWQERPAALVPLAQAKQLGAYSYLSR